MRRSGGKGTARVVVTVAILALLVFIAGVWAGYFLFSLTLGTAPIKPAMAVPTLTPTPTATPSPTSMPSPSPTPTPTLPPSPSPEEIDAEGELDARVSAVLSGMTPYEKVCQMFIVMTDSLTGVNGTENVGETTRRALEKYPVGGLLHMSGNIKSADQIAKFNADAQEASEIPLFISCDEEGGRVARLRASLGAHSVGAMLTYKDAGEGMARQNAAAIAVALKKYGFNTDMAPVADVMSNPANTVIGDRAYSDDFKQAAELVAAAVGGFKSEGVICALKHFPGHGDTSEDSHDGSAYVNKTLESLRAEEFLPFAAGIAAGADMVMLGHLTVPDIDGDYPATLSRKIATGILREELGYGGAIITDALNMRAVTGRFSAEEIAVMAVNAGADILLAPAGLERSVSAIAKAIESGEIDEARIDESVSRILKLKIDSGLMPAE
jgi:beta-N-acetylhexosaminidase